MSRLCRCSGPPSLRGCSPGAGGLVTLGPEPFSSAGFSSAGVGFSPGAGMLPCEAGIPVLLRILS